MGSKNLDYIKKYFLSFDSKEQESIYASLSDQQKNLLIEIGQAFHSNEGVSALANNNLIRDKLRELEDIQIEYFISLSELLAEGKSNEVIEKLQSSENPLFKEIFNEFCDNKSFEKDLFAGVTKIERDEVKADLLVFEVSEEISDKELQYAISKIERADLKKQLQKLENSLNEKLYSKGYINEPAAEYSYIPKVNKVNKYYYFSIAASIIFLLLSGGVYFLVNKEVTNDTVIVNTIREVQIVPDVTENLILTNQVLRDESVNGFGKISTSVKIQIRGLSKQIDTLQSILLKLSNSRGVNNDTLRKYILKKVDSLYLLMDTYHYIPSDKCIHLNLPFLPSEVRVLTLDKDGDSIMYIRIKKNYFKITKNNYFQKLIPITEVNLIEELKKVEFLNE